MVYKRVYNKRRWSKVIFKGRYLRRYKRPNLYQRSFVQGKYFIYQSKKGKSGKIKTTKHRIAAFFR